jgi:N-acetylglucosaminyldiphosphoundecaprenol N-acetyl-beta-D-mannosaminyltransferase
MIRYLFTIIKIIYSKSDKISLIQSLSQGTRVISFINLHGIYFFLKNAEFRHSILKSDIILRDGIGVNLLYNLMGKNSGLNMLGTDIIPEILFFYNKKSIAIFGTDKVTIKVAYDKMSDLGFVISCFADGFQDFDEYLNLVAEYKPEIIILGMGMPKQEVLSTKIRNSINYDCIILNGGAIIDFYGEKVSRAPEWLINFKFEWLYRFYLEPRRLFKRYFIEPFLLIPLLCIDAIVNRNYRFNDNN